MVLEKKLQKELKISVQEKKKRINFIKKQDPRRQLLQSAEEKETKKNYILIAFGCPI